MNGFQGNNVYIVPSISMAKTSTSTPRIVSGTTLGDKDNDDVDTETLAHAETSVYYENEDEDDGKNEIIEETPKGSPERKTSEGNETFS